MTAEEIKKIRKEKGLSQAQIAEFMGVSLSYITQIECGAKPVSEKFLEKFLKKFAKSEGKSEKKVFPDDFLYSNDVFSRDDLLEIRENMGLSQDSFADLIGISRGYISHVECGESEITKKLSRKIRSIIAKFSESESFKKRERAAKHDADWQKQPCAICGEPIKKHIEEEKQYIMTKYQPREVIQTVHDNNERLRMISTEIENVSKAVAAFAQFDTIVQNKVDALFAVRSRQIIAVYNHHITAQARLMINTLNNTVRVMRDGNVSTDCIVGILEDLAKQLETLKGYEPPPLI